MNRLPRALALAIFAAAACRPSPVIEPRVKPAVVVPLSAPEAQLRDAVRTHYAEAVDLLHRSVDISSGTLNVAGVRKVGALYAEEFRKLGFETTWASEPDSLHRAGHLVAVHHGSRGPRILLIGHLDTVFEGEGMRWSQEDTVGHGAGSSDMKGGDVAIILALQALAEAGKLKDMQVIVVMSGDEESAGHPISLSRAALIDAAKQSDIALAFEGGTASRVALGRRGSSNWQLVVTARQAHSAGVFSPGTGYGAAYEGARILDEFRQRLVGKRGLTFNVGVLAGGAHVVADTTGALTADGKSNIIPPIFRASGDLRFLTDPQKDSARTHMREIVSHPLEGAQSTITFEDSYPAMPVTPAGEKLLSLFSETSQSLGYPSVDGGSAEGRGAGDISFIAPFIPGMDGLGVAGAGAHSPRELVYLPSLRMAGERAAVFMSRLIDRWSNL